MKDTPLFESDGIMPGVEPASRLWPHEAETVCSVMIGSCRKTESRTTYNPVRHGGLHGLTGNGLGVPAQFSNSKARTER